jgi:hypothetical protein
MPEDKTYIKLRLSQRCSKDLQSQNGEKHIAHCVSLPRPCLRNIVETLLQSCHKEPILCSEYFRLQVFGYFIISTKNAEMLHGDTKAPNHKSTSSRMGSHVNFPYLTLPKSFLWIYVVLLPWRIAGKVAPPLQRNPRKRRCKSSDAQTSSNPSRDICSMQFKQVHGTFQLGPLSVTRLQVHFVELHINTNQSFAPEVSESSLGKKYFRWKLFEEPTEAGPALAAGLACNMNVLKQKRDTKKTAVAKGNRLNEAQIRSISTDWVEEL